MCIPQSRHSSASLGYLKEIMIGCESVFGFRDHFNNDSVLSIVISFELVSLIRAMISSDLCFSKSTSFLDIPCITIHCHISIIFIPSNIFFCVGFRRLLDCEFDGFMMVLDMGRGDLNFII